MKTFKTFYAFDISVQGHYLELYVFFLLASKCELTEDMHDALIETKKLSLDTLSKKKQNDILLIILAGWRKSSIFHRAS